MSGNEPWHVLFGVAPPYDVLDAIREHEHEKDDLEQLSLWERRYKPYDDPEGREGDLKRQKEPKGNTHEVPPSMEAG